MKFYYENYDYELKVWDEDNFTFPSAHWHTKVELAFIIEGSIWVGISNEKKLLQKGDAVIISSGEIHYYDGRDLDARVLILIFDTELINCVTGWPQNKRFFTNYISKELINTTGLKELKPCVNLIMDELKKNDDARDMLIRSHLFRICGLLLRYVPTVTIENRSKDKVLGKLKLLQDVFAYIELNYMNDITMLSISKQFNVSPKYLSRLFNSISNLNFKTHINTKRVVQAERMIIEGKLSLTEIAFECGFNSIRTFNRVYKDIKGNVPSDSR
jgi:AraC-like DNA-binding protein